jgi:hypothetical protein
VICNSVSSTNPNRVNGSSRAFPIKSTASLKDGCQTGGLSCDNFFYTHLPKMYVQLITLVMQYNVQKAAFLRKYSNHLFSPSSFSRAELQASHPPPTHTHTHLNFSEPRPFRGLELFYYWLLQPLRVVKPTLEMIGVDYLMWRSSTALDLELQPPPRFNEPAFTHVPLKPPAKSKNKVSCLRQPQF